MFKSRISKSRIANSTCGQSEISHLPKPTLLLGLSVSINGHLSSSSKNSQGFEKKTVLPIPTAKASAQAPVIFFFSCRDEEDSILHLCIGFFFFFLVRWTSLWAVGSVNRKFPITHCTHLTRNAAHISYNSSRIYFLTLFYLKDKPIQFPEAYHWDGIWGNRVLGVQAILAQRQRGTTLKSIPHFMTQPRDGSSEWHGGASHFS